MHIRTLAIGGAIAALIATSAHGQTKPKSIAVHNFAGGYATDGGMASITITRTGPARYKLAFSAMVQMVTGNFSTQEWEVTGTARGSILVITTGDKKPNCKMTFVAGKRPLYRISGCGQDMNGVYRR